MGVGGMPPDMVKTATDMITKMKPEELQKMLEVASSLNGKPPNFPNIDGDGSRFGSQIPEMTTDVIKMSSISPEELQKMLEIASTMNVNGNPSPASATHGGTKRSESGTRSGSQIPEMTPEMVEMAFDRMKNMPPEELQKMFEMASSVNLNGTPVSNSASANSTQRSESGSQPSTAEGSHTADHLDVGESSSDGLFSNSRNSQVSSSPPSSSAVLQESLRNSMKDPAMRQMFTSMMKDISPEMVANMSEQYGMKLSREDAAKVQEAMSSLSTEDLDKMMRWAERAQRGVETARRTKNWLLGRTGLILAFVMLILAFIFHRLGFIGG